MLIWEEMDFQQNKNFAFFVCAFHKNPIELYGFALHF